MSEAKTFNGDQKIKLTQIINEGMTIMQEVEDLNAGLSDTIKAIAEELEIKPAILNRATETIIVISVAMTKCVTVAASLKGVPSPDGRG